MMCQMKSCQLLQTVQKLHLKSLQKMHNFEVIQGHCNCHFLLGMFINNVYIMHCFQDVITFTVYMTALKSPSVSIRQLRLQATCAVQSMCKHIV